MFDLRESALSASAAPDADELPMRRAIELARKGAGWTNPNPLVGCVIVKQGRIIGEGWHERYGQAHAERNALEACVEDPRGAALYVTLEPCCHTGNQPPCTEAIINSGIACVVVGSRDPNPLVNGKGNAILREAGIEVREDVLREECDELNRIFFHFIRTRKPYIVAKWAMTLDGKIATRTGDSKWISNELSRADVHDMRHRLASIMVGRGTLAADDPLLTARRSEPSNQPLRIVVDSKLSISKDSKLVQSAGDSPVLVATAMPDDCDAAKRLSSEGVGIVSIPDGQGAVDLSALMAHLGQNGIDSVLVEGGGALNERIASAGLIDEAVVYLAPKVIGGRDALSPVEGRGVAKIAQALAFGEPEIERLGSDVKLTYRRRALSGGDR